MRRIRDLNRCDAGEKPDSWREHHCKLLEYQEKYRVTHKRRGLTESNWRALGVLDACGLVTPNAFARRMWPSSPVLRSGYVGGTGFGGKIDGGSLLSRNGRIQLERLRKQKLVKKVGDKYALSAKGVSKVR